MAVKQIEPAESFEERIDTLFSELEMSVEFDRPSILLAVYSSEYVRIDAEAALTARLRDLGQIVTPYRVTGMDNADIPLHLVQDFTDEQRAKTVFYISGLQWGGGRNNALAYYALNIRREYFVDYRIRAVFWLTEKEGRALPYDAPDFWAFRHRVVEFSDPIDVSQLPRLNNSARRIAWEDFQGRARYEDTQAKIEFREELLRDLPEAPETLSSRGELYYTLAGLYHAAGRLEEALDASRKALILSQQLGDRQLEARAQNGLGTVYHSLNQSEQAIEAFQRASAILPKDALPHVSLGHIYRELGKYEDAISEYRRAIQIDPHVATPHSGLGDVYSSLGYMDSAVDEYKVAIELNPKAGYPYQSLGNIYRDLKLYDEAIIAYQRALELDPSNVEAAEAVQALLARQENRG